MPEIYSTFQATPTTAKILVADDHGLVRDSIKGYLERFPELQVIATATSTDEAAEKAIAQRPNIVLMDIEMPGLSCFDAVRLIKLRVPNIKIILVSAHDSDTHIEDALKAEVDGFVAKHEGTGELIEAIRAVQEGRTHFSPRVMQRLTISQFGVSLSRPPQTRLSTISPREKELMRLLARGLSLKEAASVLGITFKTADKHNTSLMSKLGVHDRVSLARMAIREGLVEP